jgi:hypothetical protein
MVTFKKRPSVSCTGRFPIGREHPVILEFFYFFRLNNTHPEKVDIICGKLRSRLEKMFQDTFRDQGPFLARNPSFEIALVGTISTIFLILEFTTIGMRKEAEKRVTWLALEPMADVEVKSVWCATSDGSGNLNG